MPPCMFENLVHVLPSGSYNAKDSFAKKFYDVNNANLMWAQGCLTHGQDCLLFGPDAGSDLDTSGLPCWDMSIAGLKLYEEGPTNIVFMSHAKMHVEKKTPLLIIENTKDGG